MKESINLIVIMVAIGIVSLFATFFIVLGLHKKEIWQEIYKHITFK